MATSVDFQRNGLLDKDSRLRYAVYAIAKAENCGLLKLLGIMNTLRRIRLLPLLVLLVGCSKPAKPARDLSAYTNIPPGTPVIITLGIAVDSSTPKSVQTAVAGVSITEEGTLVSITPEMVVIRDASSRRLSFAKGGVASIRTNTP